MLRLIILGVFSTMLWSQDFIIITSSKTEVTKLSSFQLRQIYLGKLDRFRGQRVTPVNLKRELPAAQAFDTYLFGPTFDLANYWLTQKIKGDLKQPWTVGSPALMMALVERNPGFIGYVKTTSIDDLKGFRIKTIDVID